MLHVPTTIEEQLILRAIKEECSWESLPKRLQSTLNSKEEWHRRITEHCIKKRLPWNTSFVRKVCREGEYYEDMMRYLRRNLALFPYHLADYVCRVMRISPFRYYCDMIFEVMKNEQPYDSIPNFSAADALRLTGIGRNEFIDIMNKCRSKKIMWKLNKSIAKEALPTHPVDFAIEPWWGVCLVNFTLEEFKKLSEEETATIDKICKEEANAFILFDPVVIKGLYRRGLVYFDVPVYTDDRFKVSRLEGFVSNREQSYEDPIEELLYAVFVVSSENSTVAELATTLQAELSQLQAAASFACRLGWAVKLIDPGSVLQEQTTSALSDEEEGSLSTMASGNLSNDAGLFQQDTSGTDNHGPGSAYARVAFVVDANITSYLMMGSVSPGLKSHAVTLYEAGKLGYASIEDLCKDLSTLEGTKFEGELQEFANHAFSLRCVLECLTSGGLPPEELVTPDIGSSNNEEVTSMVADISLREESGTIINESGPLANDSTTETPKKGSDTTLSNENTDADNLLPAKSHEDSCLGGDSQLDQGLQDGEKEKLVSSEGTDVGKVTRRVRKYRVDILRCESLATLSSTTLDRLFRHDYDIVVSMVPLPVSSLLPGPKGPVHFGPPSHSSMSPWMNLVLYSAVGSGPVSVVLMKGQCLRLLPAPLAGCEKALVWSWDGSTVAGLGAKFQGNLVKGSILLHCINSLLKHTAILVQPFSKFDLNESGKTNTIDVPLPLKNSDGSFADIGKELGLGADESSKLNSLLRNLADKIPLWTIGYLRLMKLFKEGNTNMFAPDDVKHEWVPLCVEFGIPLFSPKLCNYICKRVVSSQLLQTNLFTEHHDAMQELRRRLRDICSEYQATGSSARMLYQRDQPRTQKRLMTYASQRWNPITEPSSPISGTSDLQRLKLANRQRCHTEVLSFDGTILRSYALASTYEGTTKMNEETTSGKAESDDKESGETVLPGVTLLFDGSELRPFDIGACLQARQPASLIAEASAVSDSSSAIK